MTTGTIDDSSPRHTEDPNTTDEPQKLVEAQPEVSLGVKTETTPKIAFFTKVTYVQIFHSRCWLVSVFLVLFIIKNDEIMNMQKTTVFFLEKTNAQLKRQGNQAEITLQNLNEFFMDTSETLNTLKVKVVSDDMDKTVFDLQKDANGKYKLELVVPSDETPTNNDTPAPNDHHLRENMCLLVNPNEDGTIVVDCRTFPLGLETIGLQSRVSYVFGSCFIGWLKEHGRRLDDPDTLLDEANIDAKYAVNLAEHHLPQMTVEEASEKSQQWKNELEKTERPAYEIDRGEFLAVVLALKDDSSYQQTLAELCNFIPKDVEISCDGHVYHQHLDSKGPIVFRGRNFPTLMRSLANPDENGTMIVDMDDFFMGVRTWGFSDEIRPPAEVGFTFVVERPQKGSVGYVFGRCFIGWIKEHGRGLNDPDVLLCGGLCNSAYELPLAGNHLPQMSDAEAFEKLQQWINSLREKARSAIQIDRGEFLAMILLLGKEAQYQQQLMEICDLVSENVEISCINGCGPRRNLDNTGPIVLRQNFRIIVGLLLNPDENGTIVVSCEDSFSELEALECYAGMVRCVFGKCFIGWLKEHGHWVGDPNIPCPEKSEAGAYAVNLATHHLPQLTEEEASEKLQQWKNELEKTERPAYEIDRGEFLAVILVLAKERQYHEQLLEICESMETSYDGRGPNQLLDQSGPLSFPAVVPPSPYDFGVKRCQQSA
jgi:hypothetical protein